MGTKRDSSSDFARKRSSTKKGRDSFNSNEALSRKWPFFSNPRCSLFCTFFLGWLIHPNSISSLLFEIGPRYRKKKPVTAPEIKKKPVLSNGAPLQERHSQWAADRADSVIAAEHGLD
ncbi:hypothetical protein JTE90_019237 [Oedothorax gibbosus]|uniref:Uncharacterized protein n=1 Tax=Oedothorax gibbosus TaxID=931172 RepID=A0AAV6URE2_9ARAC|nr:hypothetical protein JTE90_019237 [Oedothorax gibbosus]